MKIKRYFLTGFFVVFLGFSGFAQAKSMLNLNWNMGLSIGSTNNIISKPSLSGLSFDLRVRVGDQVTIGGTLGWNLFFKDFGHVQEVNGNTINSGYKRRYSSIVPIMFTVHYYFSRKRQVQPYTFKDIVPGNVRPYIGLGIGGYMITARDLMGNSSVSNNFYHFGLQPEIGIMYLFGNINNNNFAVNASFKYNMAFKTSNDDASSWFGINLGMAYLF